MNLHQDQVVAFKITGGSTVFRCNHETSDRLTQKKAPEGRLLHQKEHSTINTVRCLSTLLKLHLFIHSLELGGSWLIKVYYIFR